MLRSLKNILYFRVAFYFGVFARIRLARWKPRIVVVTGSNGKTTALNLIEVQLGPVAKYSHGANSSFGIPFDILGLKRKSYSVWEWPLFAIFAPFCMFKKLPSEKIYVVEADCDRPFEGKFLSRLLRPEVTVWLSSDRSHSQNFDRKAGMFKTIDQVIADEFGNFLERTSELEIVNADNELILKEAERTHAEIFRIQKRELQKYEVTREGTMFEVDGRTFSLPYLLPQEVFCAIAASLKVAEYFGVPQKTDLSGFNMPPGRSSILRGIKDTTIIDSSYNTNAASVAAILAMVEQFPAEKKWLILGDLTEQGDEEKEEHEKVARSAAQVHFEKIILIGPRLKRYALPILQNAVAFDEPSIALEYIRDNLQGTETLVFKGARFLEGIIEHLLADKADAAKLCRRETVWQKRRAQWGL